MQPEPPKANPKLTTVKWHVIRAKPHRERLVDEQLRNQGIEVFFPTVRVQPVNPRSARDRAYFPGYLFIHTDLSTIGVNRLNWLPAAIGVLEFGGEPAVVPDLLISQLRSRIRTIQAAGGMIYDGLKHGDPVRITSGPFAGYEAIFDLRLQGSDRVRVLMDLLRRQVAIDVDAGSIRKLGASNMVKSSRKQR